MRRQGQPAERETRAGASPRRTAGVLLRAYRPRQWSKNLLVLAAPAAAGVIDRPLVIAQLAATFLALCLLSSATYLFNDVRDREQDRLHPRKRLRPIAAGEIAPARALQIAGATALVGLALASAVDVKVGVIGCCYLALTVSYSLWWRGVVVLDILVIAAGFVLRALAGGVATDIYLSRWFVIVTASCAIFVVAAKRYAELRGRGRARRAGDAAPLLGLQPAPDVERGRRGRRRRVRRVGVEPRRTSGCTCSRPRRSSRCSRAMSA